jgi:hypothetical protein
MLCYPPPPPPRSRILRYLYGDHLSRCWLLADVKPKFFDALLGVARLETFMPQVCAWCLGEGGAGRQVYWADPLFRKRLQIVTYT